MVSLIAAAVLACASSGCSKVSTSGSLTSSGNPGTIHGIVRMAIIADPNTLNPVLSGLIQEGYVEGAIFNGLVKFDSAAHLQPDLALQVPSLRNGGISRDGKTITYHLRHDVSWQDGAPFTAADVAFTYRMYTNPKVNTYYNIIYKRIVRLETPDPYTVVVHLQAPFAPALMQFFERNTGGYVVPAHLLEHSGNFNTDPFGKHPVGTGAFKFARWDHGSLIVLVANPHYFGGSPKLREVDIHIVANPNTQVVMAASHELDIAGYLAPSQYVQIQHISGVHSLLISTLLERYLTFNLKREPFNDPVVRQALTMALDRARMTQNAYLGTATLGQTLIPQSSWAYDPNTAPPYDPEGAKALLDRDGWHVGADGIREKNGRQLAFNLLNQTELSPLAVMAQEMQRDWQRIGAAVSIRTVPKGIIFSNPDGLATSGRFDALLDDWEADPDPDRSQLVETKSWAPASYNDAFYSNAQVDRWSETALASYDETFRKPIYSLLQRQLNRDLPYVPLAWEGRIYAVSNDMKGFAPAPGSTDFWNAETWQN